MGQESKLTLAQRAKIKELIRWVLANDARFPNQEALAAKLKVKQATISQAKSGKQGLGFMNAIWLCDLVKRDYVELLGLPPPFGWIRSSSLQRDPPELEACISSHNYPPTVVAALRARCHEERVHMTEAAWSVLGDAILQVWRYHNFDVHGDRREPDLALQPPRAPQSSVVKKPAR